MNILALPAAWAFTMNVTLCLIVPSSNPKNIANRLFACFVLSFATWNVGKFIMNQLIVGVAIAVLGFWFVVRVQI